MFSLTIKAVPAAKRTIDAVTARARAFPAWEQITIVTSLLHPTGAKRLARIQLVNHWVFFLTHALSVAVAHVTKPL